MGGVRVSFFFSDEAMKKNDMTRQDILDEFGHSNEDIKSMEADGIVVTLEEID